MMLSLAMTQARMNCANSGVTEPKPIRSSIFKGSLRNLRMVRQGPISESGGMIALTRGPLGKTRIHHRRCFVNAPAQRGDDPLDHLEDLHIVDELYIGQAELALLLDVDLVRAVDHHFRDVVAVQQRLNRAIAKNIGDQHVKQVGALGAAHHQMSIGQTFVKDRLDHLA